MLHNLLKKYMSIYSHKFLWPTAVSVAESFSDFGWPAVIV
nr:MAG TPA: hypothetical protein [Caudoviricetes sp.]